MNNPMYDKNKDLLLINGVLIDNKDLADGFPTPMRNREEMTQVTGINGGIQQVRTSDKTGTMTVQIYIGSEAYKMLLDYKEKASTFDYSIVIGGIDHKIVGLNANVAKMDNSLGESAVCEVTIICETLLGT